MKIVAWNIGRTTGSWICCAQLMDNLIPSYGNGLVLGLLTEAGTPPNDWYDVNLPTNPVRIKAKAQWINGNLRVEGAWVLWNKTNAVTGRYDCSLACLAAPSPSRQYNLTFTWAEIPRLAGKLSWARPYIDCSQPGLAIFLVHLPSGPKNLTLNIKSLLSLMNIAEQNSQAYGRPAIIVGDLNINIETGPRGAVGRAAVLASLITPNPKWTVMRTGQSTIRTGGELDWGLAYCCSGNAQILVPLTHIPSGDHAALVYDMQI